MNMQAKWNGLVVFAGLCVIALLNCSPSRLGLEGPTTQTGNGMVAGVIFQPDGKTPARGAIVCLRKKNTLADIPGALMKKLSDSTVTLTTDNNGAYIIDSIDTGIYVLEATDGVNALALHDSIPLKNPDSTVVLPPDTLKPAGAIKGVIRLTEGGDPRKVFVLAYGLDRFANVETDGTFKFGKLAETNYHLRIISTLDNYGVFDTSSIPVKSADTNDIGVVEIPFTGIPTVKNLTIAYDTLQQRVELRWNRHDTASVKSFNVYRRDIDPATAVMTQLNFFPIIDTFFIDSFCEQNKSYEYHVTAVDANTNEGTKGPGATTRIALYEIPPKNIVMAYDTLRQTVTLTWSNPDTSLVKSYNVYRRNIRLNETFWTPFNNGPIRDTFFIDSTFMLCPTGDASCDDPTGLKNPTYEYCVASLIHDIREGARSSGIPLRICTTYLTPTNVNFTYDTLKQLVHLRWNRPDMTIVRGFVVFRRNIDENVTGFSQINDVNGSDTFYTDSTGAQNQFYEYCVASVVKNNRAEVKSAGVNVHIAASFIEDAVFIDGGNVQGRRSSPNDIAVAANGDIYIVDQGNSRIQVFDSTMRYKTHIGNGILDYPLKVSVDYQGKIFAADYNSDRDYSSIYIFDGAGATIDTILDSMVINDLDVKDGLLYAVTEGRSISIYSYDGNKKRSWQVSGQDGGKCIVAGDMNRIFVSTGLLFPDKNKVIAFDSLGSAISSMTLPSYPYAIAFDEMKQLLYIVCYNGMHGSMLHVMDRNNVERANYKIQNDDQNISIGIQKNGAVFVVLKGEGKIIKLKPIAVF